MTENVRAIAQTDPVDLSVRAGSSLRRIRERLGLTLRDVEEATLEISSAENNDEYFVSVARLNQIENDGSLPSIYKLYSLAVVLQLGLEEILDLYGITVAKMDEFRAKMPLSQTHLLSVEGGDPNRSIRFPIRFDAGFRPEKTVFLSRLIEAWGEIPMALLANLNFRKHRYGYIGLEDRMMAPLIRPGSIVQIDDTRKRVVNHGWMTEADRPIYFLELRYSYECCWCYMRGHELTLVPHPLSSCGPRTIRVPDEGEVLGQVVGVAMRLVQHGP
jgi:transcriptional regulator with XRE-family HTH domain